MITISEWAGAKCTSSNRRQASTSLPGRAAETQASAVIFEAFHSETLLSILHNPCMAWMFPCPKVFFRLSSYVAWTGFRSPTLPSGLNFLADADDCDCTSSKLSGLTLTPLEYADTASAGLRSFTGYRPVSSSFVPTMHPSAPLRSEMLSPDNRTRHPLRKVASAMRFAKEFRGTSRLRYG